MFRRDVSFLFGAAWMTIAVVPCFSQSNSYNPGQPFSFSQMGSMSNRPYAGTGGSAPFNTPAMNFAPSNSPAPPSNINGAPQGQATFLQPDSAPPSNINGAPPGQATFLQSDSAPPSNINGAPPGQATYLQSTPPQTSSNANSNEGSNTSNVSHSKKKGSKNKIASAGGGSSAAAIPQTAPPRFDEVESAMQNGAPQNYAPVNENATANNTNYAPNGQNGQNGSNGPNWKQKINWNGLSRTASNVLRSTGALRVGNGYYNPYGYGGYGGINPLNIINRNPYPSYNNSTNQYQQPPQQQAYPQQQQAYPQQQQAYPQQQQAYPPQEQGYPQQQPYPQQGYPQQGYPQQQQVSNQAALDAIPEPTGVKQ